jgi:S-formylglutathione hydrolase
MMYSTSRMRGISMRPTVWRVAALRIAAAALFVTSSASARAQQAASGQIVIDTMHAKSLEKNLYGDSPDRSMMVYLPASYASSPTKRYPVVYLLHGYGGNEGEWRGLAPLKPAMDTLVRNGTVREMIVVMPNGRNALDGSFYTNSLTTGNWDDFISKELVAFIDTKYRTLARPESRGLAGHSMGGYGTFAVGMRHAGDVYSALYALSGCCTQVSSSAGNGATWNAVASAHSLAEARQLPFIPKVSLALAAAFSPNPNAPPLFVNLPFVRNGDKWELVDSVYRQWVAHAPYDMIPTYASQLKRLRGFMFDVGMSDALVAPTSLAAMDSALTRAGVRHTFETYDGDHTNRIAARLATRLLPFFSQTLDFGDGTRR